MLTCPSKSGQGQDFRIILNWPMNMALYLLSKNFFKKPEPHNSSVETIFRQMLKWQKNSNSQRSIMIENVFAFASLLIFKYGQDKKSSILAHNPSIIETWFFVLSKMKSVAFLLVLLAVSANLGLQVSILSIKLYNHLKSYLDKKKS